MVLFIFLCCANAFELNWVPFVYFCFYFYYSKKWVKKDLAAIYMKTLYLCFPLSVIVLSLTFGSLIYFEFFVHRVKGVF